MPQNESVNINEMNLKFAFTFRKIGGSGAWPVLDDDRYVKIRASYIDVDYSVWPEKDPFERSKLLGYHLCTEEDWDQFYPAREGEESYI